MKKKSVLKIFIQITITLASLGVIAFIWAITISPIEFVRFHRDKQRAADIYSLIDILSELEERSPEAFYGKPQSVYVSLPDKDPACSHWDLSPLAEGFVYHCASFADYRRTDSRGWLPINLSGRRRFSQLPIDPLNGQKAGNALSRQKKLYFYQYIPGSFYISVSQLESRQGWQKATDLAGGSRFKQLEEAEKGRKFPPLAAVFFEGSLGVGNPEDFIKILPPEKKQKLEKERYAGQRFFIEQLNRSAKKKKNLSQKQKKERRQLLLPAIKKETKTAIKEKTILPVKGVTSSKTTIVKTEPKKKSKDTFGELNQWLEDKIKEKLQKIAAEEERQKKEEKISIVQPPPSPSHYNDLVNRCLQEGGAPFLAGEKVCCRH